MNVKNTFIYDLPEYIYVKQPLGHARAACGEDKSTYVNSTSSSPYKSSSPFLRLERYNENEKMLLNKLENKR